MMVTTGMWLRLPRWREQTLWIGELKARRISPLLQQRSPFLASNSGCPTLGFSDIGKGSSIGVTQWAQSQWRRWRITCRIWLRPCHYRQLNKSGSVLVLVPDPDAEMNSETDETDHATLKYVTRASYQSGGMQAGSCKENAVIASADR
mmetsp:Transcript_54794/g.119875  ORF Transcript_54794/g.119875 Transcript_54794/m.119875 type:complete len:148 (+) Transcript_54794:506-949(+)